LWPAPQPPSDPTVPQQSFKAQAPSINGAVVHYVIIRDW